MKTKCGLDAVIKHTDDTYHCGVVEGKAYAKWNKKTGVCVDPCGNSAFDLMIEQKPKYELPDPTNRHYKFAKYCQSIGYPDIEILHNGSVIWGASPNPKWIISGEYRIAGDPHHELRREWIDSDFTLQFESSLDGVTWRKSKAKWKSSVKYRKAEKKPLWHEYLNEYDIPMVFNGGVCGIFDKQNENMKPCTTTDGKHLIGFKYGHAYILPVEHGDTQLGINPEMDKLARENGLEHWSCVSKKSGALWWIRQKDGMEATISEYPTNEYVIGVLKFMDEQHPLEAKQ